LLLHIWALKKLLTLIVFSVLLLVSVGEHDASAITIFGPAPYLSFAGDSPFSGTDFSSGYFHLENFESLVPGVTNPLSTPGVLGIGAVSGPLNGLSVDEDSGAIDGSSIGNFYVNSFPSPLGDFPIEFTFNQGILGNYPTHAGIVLTGNSFGVVPGPTSIEFYDSGNILVHSVLIPLTLSTATSDDRFVGVIEQNGISKIIIRGSMSTQLSANLGVDHLQYGFIPPSDRMAVGGELIPLDTTSLLLTGAQMNAAWMIPIIVSAIGIGIVLARKF